MSDNMDIPADGLQEFYNETGFMDAKGDSEEVGPTKMDEPMFDKGMFQASEGDHHTRINDSAMKVDTNAKSQGINFSPTSSGGTFTMSGGTTMSGGPTISYDSSPNDGGESETPYEVLDDHKRYLGRRKAEVETELKEMTKRYAELEERLTVIDDNITQTEKAMNPLDKTE